MHYKKRLATLSSLLLTITLLCSCSQTDYSPYTVLELGSEEADAVYKIKDPEDYTAPAEMTVTLNGKEYSGTYDRTGVARLCTYNMVFYYEAEEYYFTVSEKTGKLEHIHYDKRKFPQSSVQLNQEEARSLADSIADDHITLRDYEVEEDYRSSMDEYSFTYCRYIGGYKTSDQLSITLHSSGEIIDFLRTGTGGFDGVKSVKINQNKVDKAIEKKLKEIIKRDVPSDAEDIEYSVDDYLCLMPLENGQFALYYPATIEHSRGHGHYSLLVIVNHQEKR